jgi:hypothetical protein
MCLALRRCCYEIENVFAKLHWNPRSAFRQHNSLRAKCDLTGTICKRDSGFRNPISLDSPHGLEQLGWLRHYDQRK